jgi:hypothetical protein
MDRRGRSRDVGMRSATSLDSGVSARVSRADHPGGDGEKNEALPGSVESVASPGPASPVGRPPSQRVVPMLSALRERGGHISWRGPEGTCDLLHDPSWPTASA